MEYRNIRINRQTMEELDFSADSHGRYRTGIVEPLSWSGAAFPWHWHTEVECFYVQQGRLTFRLQCGDYAFGTGDVGFVNSGVLHMVSLAGQEDCRLQNHIFLPRMICGDDSAIEARYVSPLVRNSAAQILSFRAETAEAQRMRRWMDEAHAAHTGNAFARELLVRDCMSRVWTMLLESMPPFSNAAADRDSQRLMLMLQHVAAHYSEKIALEELAEAAHISSKECERCFQKQIRMAPFDYIREYRLEKARGFLHAGESSITEIGQRCGFATSSYFGKCFKERYGMSPRDYVKKKL